MNIYNFEFNRLKQVTLENLATAARLKAEGF